MTRKTLIVLIRHSLHHGLLTKVFATVIIKVLKSIGVCLRLENLTSGDKSPTNVGFIIVVPEFLSLSPLF